VGFQGARSNSSGVFAGNVVFDFQFTGHLVPFP
jgi:hypothetical protein